jgi:hypothetical protein
VIITVLPGTAIRRPSHREKRDPQTPTVLLDDSVSRQTIPGSTQSPFESR